MIWCVMRDARRAVDTLTNRKKRDPSVLFGLNKRVGNAEGKRDRAAGVRITRGTGDTKRERYGTAGSCSLYLTLFPDKQHVLKPALGTVTVTPGREPGRVETRGRTFADCPAADGVNDAESASRYLPAVVS